MTSKTAEPSSSRSLRGRLERVGVSGVTASKIERWSKAGLLPPARRRGRGQGRGTVSAYPPGTVAQVRALVRLLERHRNVNKVAVLLKINGYTVSARACRQAIEQLVLNPLDDLDPLRRRHEQAPEAVAADAARRVASRRVRTEHDRATRSRDLARAGGRDQFVHLLRGLLLPLYGGVDRAAYSEILNAFGLAEAARKINAAVPALGEYLAEQAQLGGMQIDRIRADLMQLDVDDFDTAVRMARVLLAAFEAVGVRVTSSEPFLADCLAALRRPEHRLTPPAGSETGEVEAESTALAFFARRERANARAKSTTESRQETTQASDE